MRETYIPLNDSTPGPRRVEELDKREVSSAARFGLFLAGTMLDLLSLIATPTVLWLGAGATVLSGNPLFMSVAFAIGVILVGGAALLRRETVRSIVAAALISIVVLAIGVFGTELSVGGYFLEWTILYAAAQLGAGALIAVVLDAFAGRGGGAIVARALVITSSVVVVLLLSRVWSDSALLGDVVVFALLLNAAARGLAAGVRTSRKVDPS